LRGRTILGGGPSSTASGLRFRSGSTQDLIILPVKVNGKGPHDFLFETGNRSGHVLVTFQRVLSNIDDAAEWNVDGNPTDAGDAASEPTRSSLLEMCREESSAHVTDQ